MTDYAKRLDACRKNWHFMPRMKIQAREGYVQSEVEWTVLAVKGDQIETVRCPHEETARAMGAKMYIMKPVNFKQLAGIVRQVLDSETPDMEE